VALHLLGVPHPAESGDRLDRALFDHGYEPGTYREGSGLIRRYVNRYRLSTDQVLALTAA
jgi:hypothetical protein